MRYAQTFGLTIAGVMLVVSCQEQSTNANGPEDNFTMSIQYEVIPENLEEHYFSISWTDTLGSAIGMDSINWHARPVEIWCEVLASNSDSIVLGDYHGMSTPQRFLYFQTKDSLVDVRFSIGPNVFSELMTSELKTAMQLPIRLKPITISLNKNLRTPISITLEQE